MKFLLEKDFGVYDLKKWRAEKEAQEKQLQKARGNQTKSNKTSSQQNKQTQTDKNYKSYKELQNSIKNDNKFKHNKYENLLDAKKDYELYSQKEYNKLNDGQRTDFIINVINKMKNANTLNKAKYQVVKAIKQSNWNKDIVYYLNKIDNVGLDNSIIELMSELIADKKIDPKKSVWYNKSLYDRNRDDILYTIKALTLVLNKSLQLDDKGNNKFFDDDNPLNLTDLMDGDIVKGADEIIDIINSKQTKDVEFKNTKSPQAKTLLKQQTQKNDAEIDKTLNIAQQKIVDEVTDALIALGFKKPLIANAIKTYFRENSTTEEIIEDILRNYYGSKS